MPGQHVHGRRRLRVPRAALLVGLVLGSLAAPPPAAAQGVAGRVLDRVDRRPLEGARVLLLDEAGRVSAAAVTDSAGGFDLPARSPAGYVLRAERLGYAPTVTRPFFLPGGEALEVELWLSAAPVAVEPVLVVGRRPASSGAREFYARLEQRRKAGAGRFLTRAEILEMRAPDLSGVLRRIPDVEVHALDINQAKGLALTQVRMRVRGRLCTPRVVVDGRTVAIEYVDPDDLLAPTDAEGIEVYDRPTEAPDEYVDRGGCGTILLWTHTGSEAEGPRRTRWRHLAGGAIAALIAALALGSL